MDGRFAVVAMMSLLLSILCRDAAQAYTLPSPCCLPELLISADDVLSNPRVKRNMILVDIRPAAAFELLRIPGSLNLPVFTIKAKNFLKNRNLVLVDEGYRHAQWAAACRPLIREGFRLHVLDGGLSAWNRRGGALVGDQFARRSLNRLTPLNFFTEKDCGNWTVVRVSEGGGKRSEAVGLFPRTVAVPYAEDHVGFAARYEELLKNEIGKPCARILVTDDRGEHYGPLERIIGNTSVPDAFFLEGGIEGYERFVRGIRASGKRLSTMPAGTRCAGNP